MNQSEKRNKKNFSALKDFMLIAAGVVCAGFGINGFLLSSHFIDGGVTGISMLLTDIFGYPISLLLALINVPFIIPEDRIKVRRKNLPGHFRSRFVPGFYTLP
jgi:uncharacterized membrane-anchored protein YitT (DUF2179 family)